MLSRSLCATFFLGLACTCGLAEEQIATLQPVYSVGQTSYVELHWNWSVDKTVSKPNSSPEKSNSSAEKTWGFLQKVTEISPDGTVHIELTFDRAVLSVVAPDLSVSYDTDAPETHAKADHLPGFLQSLIGKKLTLRVFTNGEVIAKGMEKVRDGMPAELKDATVYRYVRSVLYDQWHEFIWQQLLYTYSYRHIAKGDTWAHRFGDDHDGFECKYTVAEITPTDKTSNAVVRYTASRPADVPSAASPKPGESQHSHGELMIKGAAKFDGKIGRIVRIDETSTEKVLGQACDQDGAITTTNVVTKTTNVIRELTLEQRKAERSAAAPAPIQAKETKPES